MLLELQLYFFNSTKLNEMMMMMMMMIDDDDDDELFCGMVDQRKTFSLISSWNHCQKYSPSPISNTM